MDRAKVYRVTAICWLKIVFFFLVGAGILGYLGYRIADAYSDAGVSKILLAVLAVVGLFSPLFVLRKAFRKLISRGDHRAKVPLSTQAKVQNIVDGLYRKRGKTPPLTVFLSDAKAIKRGGFRAAFLDQPIGTDVLVLGEKALEKLDDEELQGVIAHESRHDDAFDNVLNIVLQGLTMAVCLMYWVGFLCVTFGVWWHNLGLYLGLTLLAYLARLALSRARETKTDVLSALDLGSSRPLARALENIQQVMLDETGALNRKKPSESWFGNLWRSHPYVSRRVKVLKSVDT